MQTVFSPQAGKDESVPSYRGCGGQQQYLLPWVPHISAIALVEIARGDTIAKAPKLLTGIGYPVDAAASLLRVLHSGSRASGLVAVLVEQLRSLPGGSPAGTEPKAAPPAAAAAGTTTATNTVNEASVATGVHSSVSEGTEGTADQGLSTDKAADASARAANAGSKLEAIKQTMQELQQVVGCPSQFARLVHMAVRGVSDPWGGVGHTVLQLLDNSNPWSALLTIEHELVMETIARHFTPYLTPLLKPLRHAAYCFISAWLSGNTGLERCAASYIASRYPRCMMVAREAASGLCLVALYRTCVLSQTTHETLRAAILQRAQHPVLSEAVLSLSNIARLVYSVGNAELLDFILSQSGCGGGVLAAVMQQHEQTKHRTSAGAQQTLLKWFFLRNNLDSLDLDSLGELWQKLGDGGVASLVDSLPEFDQNKLEFSAAGFQARKDGNLLCAIAKYALAHDKLQTIGMLAGKVLLPFGCSLLLHSLLWPAALQWLLGKEYAPSADMEPARRKVWCSICASILRTARKEMLLAEHVVQLAPRLIHFDPKAHAERLKRIHRLNFPAKVFEMCLAELLSRKQEAMPVLVAILEDTAGVEPAPGLRNSCVEISMHHFVQRFVSSPGPCDLDPDLVAFIGVLRSKRGKKELFIGIAIAIRAVLSVRNFTAAKELLRVANLDNSTVLLNSSVSALITPSSGEDCPVIEFFLDHSTLCAQSAWRLLLCTVRAGGTFHNLDKVLTSPTMATHIIECSEVRAQAMAPAVHPHMARLFEYVFEARMKAGRLKQAGAVQLYFDLIVSSCACGVLVFGFRVNEYSNKVDWTAKIKQVHQQVFQKNDSKRRQEDAVMSASRSSTASTAPQTATDSALQSVPVTTKQATPNIVAKAEALAKAWRSKPAHATYKCIMSTLAGAEEHGCTLLLAKLVAADPASLLQVPGVVGRALGFNIPPRHGVYHATPKGSFTLKSAPPWLVPLFQCSLEVATPASKPVFWRNLGHLLASLVLGATRSRVRLPGNEVEFPDTWQSKDLVAILTHPYLRVLKGPLSMLGGKALRCLASAGASLLSKRHMLPVCVLEEWTESMGLSVNNLRAHTAYVLKRPKLLPPDSLPLLTGDPADSQRGQYVAAMLAAKLRQLAPAPAAAAAPAVGSAAPAPAAAAAAAAAGSVPQLPQHQSIRAHASHTLLHGMDDARIAAWRGTLHTAPPGHPLLRMEIALGGPPKAQRVRVAGLLSCCLLRSQHSGVQLAGALAGHAAQLLGLRCHADLRVTRALADCAVEGVNCTETGVTRTQFIASVGVLLCVIAQDVLLPASMLDLASASRGVHLHWVQQNKGHQGLANTVLVRLAWVLLRACRWGGARALPVAMRNARQLTQAPRRLLALPRRAIVLMRQQAVATAAEGRLPPTSGVAASTLGNKRPRR